MQRRDLLVAGAAVAVAGCASPLVGDAAPLRRVAFGSCNDQNRPQEIWPAILDAAPGLMLFGGDNVYCDMPFSREALQRADAAAGASPGLARLRAAVPHLAIWDDNDDGRNDGGADFAGKQASKDEFLAFWQVPADDARRRREGLSPDGAAYPLTELTASGFTHTWRDVHEAGPNRIGAPFTELHFGTVDLDWAGRAVQLGLVDVQGRTRRSLDLSFDELKVPS